ncbi:velvet factor family protein [Aspergillus saccharolyticus JOP 1030-1]|uniref:Velvet domain-containing protein n=1 Tax=Aspergillus saccharolyticus JOP 1030-1 TaxID=1450539 RepID=A0A318ZKI7_9EURO|nr:hypothetical protein BP01DRAFT_202275 [Aspergillus saccharolyticus JOP 1030-1]PYH40748.1 hypothetical protein BP01DRAFT_202275 [Aspergillus saccharolyticus JOP 1030-1]
MSRTPVHPWRQATSGGQYSDGRAETAGVDREALTAAPSQSYPTAGLPRFSFPTPTSEGYNLTVASAPFNSRSSYQERVWDPVAHQKHDVPSFSSYSAGDPAPSGTQRSAILRNVDDSMAGPSPGHCYDCTGGSSVSVVADKSRSQQPQRQNTTSMPSGFERLLHHSPTPSPPPRQPASTSRYHLFIRQQPLAARACGAGDRDRRPIDPPPIIQMLLTNFDPESSEDNEILQDPRFTVGCFLIPEPGVTQSEMNADGTGRADELSHGQCTPLLSGKAFVSPFYVEEDPDPSTAPAHPSSVYYAPEKGIYSPRVDYQSSNPHVTKQPATFYIFSDLSVRTAGLYRLQFRLMNWGHVEDTGKSMPILAEAWTDPFRVYPAKDFPGMRDSSPLTEGLKELGFVELKTRGKGKGKGRRR